MFQVSLIRSRYCDQTDKSEASIENQLTNQRPVFRARMGSRLLERVSQAWPRGGGRSGHKSQNVEFSKYDAMVWTMKVTRVGITVILTS